MTWSNWYRFNSYIKSALWIVPLISIVLEQIMTRVAHALDHWLAFHFLGLHVAGAQAMLQTIITLTLSFIVFTFGSLLIAIQVASGQYTPRVIATTFLRDNTVRYIVGVFVFTLLFALRDLDRMDTTVHQFVTFLAALFGLVSIVAFLYLIDYAARMLRPVSIVARVGEQGLAVIESVYPHVVTGPDNPSGLREKTGVPERSVLHQGKSAIVIAVNLHALVAKASKLNGVIEFVPHVGDFVAMDEPLFHLYGGVSASDDRKLRGLVAFGPERTIEQDPMFAFRILIDIALKALSKAINDPTTAVLALDQIHRLLRKVGTRRLRIEEILDRAGQLRVIFRTPNWQDFVHLAFCEIRHFGAEQMQIARRLRAMIENLVRALPEHRNAALRQELDLLDRMLEKLYVLPQDLALARIPDPQGLGGSSGM